MKSLKKKINYSLIGELIWLDVVWPRGASQDWLLEDSLTFTFREGKHGVCRARLLFVQLSWGGNRTFKDFPEVTQAEVAEVLGLDLVSADSLTRWFRSAAARHDAGRTGTRTGVRRGDDRGESEAS